MLVWKSCAIGASTNVSKKKSKASSAQPRKHAANVFRWARFSDLNKRNASIKKTRNPNIEIRDNFQNSNQSSNSNNTLKFRVSDLFRDSNFGFAKLDWLVRYLVKAKLKPGKVQPLMGAIDTGNLGRGSIAGDEYIHNMNQARIDQAGIATWVETCFCDPPLAEERPYWEEFFDLLSVKDAHSRRTCRHENGTEPWACCDCDCTRKPEAKLASKANRFWGACAATWRDTRCRVPRNRRRQRGTLQYLQYLFVWSHT